jgi:hypothetical protein
MSGGCAFQSGSSSGPCVWPSRVGPRNCG